MDDWLNSVLRHEQLLGAPISSWAAVVPLVIVVLLGLMLRRSLKRSDDDYDPSADRYAPTVAISEEQIALLHYLQRAFPDEAVLFQPSLARFMTVRRCRDRRLAQAKLARVRVDFLVCADDGQPWIAFDVDPLNGAETDDSKRRMKHKRAMLSAAEVRLIRLKGGLRNPLPPAEMRARWTAAAKAPVSEALHVGRSLDSMQPTDWALMGLQDSIGPAHAARQSSRGSNVRPIGRSASRQLGADNDPWANTLKRS